MSLLLFFSGGGTTVTITGSTINVTVAAPSGAVLYDIVITGSTINVTIAAPSGAIFIQAVKQVGGRQVWLVAANARTGVRLSGGPTGAVLSTRVPTGAGVS